MIIKAFTTFAEWNQTGLDQLFLYNAEVVPAFIPMFLFAFYTIILLGSYFTEKRLTGRGQVSVSMAVSGFALVVVSQALNLVDGLVNLTTLIICFAVFVIGILFLFLNKNS